MTAAGHGETRRDRNTLRPASNLASRKKPILICLDGMCLYFNYGMAGKHANPLQPSLWFKWWQREEEVDETVAAAQPIINDLTIESVCEALLTVLK